METPYRPYLEKNTNIRLLRTASASVSLVRLPELQSVVADALVSQDCNGLRTEETMGVS
jgi:hypothetical protein